MTTRIDELDKYYKSIDQLDKVDSYIFWFSAILSVVVLYESKIPWPNLQDIPSALFVALVIAHLMISLYLRFYLMPLAEKMRRKQLLSDSFGVHLVTEKAQNYYNNQLAPSIARLGANVLENSLFAKTICAHMATRERVRVLLYFTVWILAVVWRSTDLGLVVIITQTLFSSEIIEKWVRLELLRHNNESIYDELYKNFFHKINLESPNGIATIIDAFSLYEATKAMAGIKQSTSVFWSVNDELSVEWKRIREQLEMDLIAEPEQ